MQVLKLKLVNNLKIKFLSGNILCILKLISVTMTVIKNSLKNIEHLNIGV